MKRLYLILAILLIPALVYAYTVGTSPNMVPANWAAYAVDPGATDSGVTSTSQVTLLNLVTDIGTTKKATIIFPHTGSGTTTQYTIGTALDLSSYSNITFQFENGAQLKVSDGVSGISIYSPLNIKAQTNQQIVSGTSLYFSKGGTVHPESWGAIGDNSTDCTTAINAAITAISSAGGGTVKLSQGIYRHTGIIMKTHVTLEGAGIMATYLRLNSATANGIQFNTAADSDYPTIKDMTIDCVTSSTGTGILNDGTKVCRDPLMDRLYIEDFDNGIALAWSLNGTIRNTRLGGPGKATAGSIGIQTYTSAGGSTTTITVEDTYVSGYETNFDMVSHPNRCSRVISGTAAYHFHSRGTISISDLWIEAFDTAADKAFKSTLGIFIVQPRLRIYTAAGASVDFDNDAVFDLDATGIQSSHFFVHQQAARAYRNSSGVSIPTTSTTKVQWNAEMFDQNNNMDIATDFRFVNHKPIAHFSVDSTIYWDAQYLDSFISIYKNGVEYSTVISGTSQSRQISIGDVVELERNGYIEIFARQNSGTTHEITNGSNKSWVSIVELPY